VNIPKNLSAVDRDIKSLSEQIYLNLNTFHFKNLLGLIKELFFHQVMTLQQLSRISYWISFLIEIVKYPSLDFVMELEDVVHHPNGFLHTFNLPGIPLHNVCLKIGAPIVLLLHLIPPKLCNCT